MESPDFQPWQSALIDDLRVAHLGTLDPVGRPHLVPVCYAFAQGQFFIPIDEKPKSSRHPARIRNIERDSRVSLLFDRYDDDWTRLAWIRVDGDATVIAQGDFSPHALQALRDRYSQYRQMDLESALLIAVAPGRHTAWRWHG